jgi:hypothetical protein
MVIPALEEAMRASGKFNLVRVLRISILRYNEEGRIDEFQGGVGIVLFNGPSEDKVILFYYGLLKVSQDRYRKPRWPFLIWIFGIIW